MLHNSCYEFPGPDSCVKVKRLTFKPIVTLSKSIEEKQPNGRVNISAAEGLSRSSLSGHGTV